MGVKRSSSRVAWRIVGAVLGHLHRAELVDEDLLAIEAVAALLEDHGARRADLTSRATSSRKGESAINASVVITMSINRFTTPR